MSAVLKFPTARIVRERWYRPERRDPEMEQLDAAYAAVNQAIRALHRQRLSILRRMHRKVGVPPADSERVLAAIARKKGLGRARHR
jgi:hypothetical protein